ncbi:MAG: PAS domain S-box protein [Rhodospirillales bacterium]|nr:PAS domain S-box protein [Rhodospirillales bacterium]
MEDTDSAGDPSQSAPQNKRTLLSTLLLAFLGGGGLFGSISFFGQMLGVGLENIRVQSIVVPVIIGGIAAAIIAYLVAKNRKLLADQLFLERETSQNLSKMMADRTKQLAESEAKFRVFAETSPNAVAISRMSDGLLQYCNPATSAILGYKIEDIVGHQAPEFYYNPEDREPLVERLRKTGSIQNHELYMKKADGTPLPVLFSAAVTEFENEPHIFIEVIDIAERKAVETALMQSEHRFRKFYNETPVMLHSVTEDGTITHVSDYWLEHLGYERGEVIGKNIMDFQDEDSRRFTMEVGLSHFLETGVQFNLPLRFVKKNGEVIDVLLSALIERNENGGFANSLSVIVDITEQRKAEAELEQAKDTAQRASRVKSEFLSSVSHELRTPMNAIMGFGQLLESDRMQPLTEKQEKYTNHILRGGEHLLQLIDQVLQLSEVEAGRVSLSIENVDPDDVIDECMTMVMQRAHINEITVTKETGGAVLPVLWTDKMRFRQVFLNLLSNAVKYNRRGGSVTIRSRPASGHYQRFSVTDTGLGIPKDKQAGLFEPFNRLGRETGEIEGTGIGLTITSQMMALLNGRLGFESEEGTGSTFWVELPLSSNQPNAIGEGPLKDVQLETVNFDDIPSGRILYIEDNPPNLRLMEEVINRIANMTMQSAPDAETGLDMASSLLPDLILMDINLPGINGVEALRLLRQSERTRHIPVIALSARAMPDEIARGLKAGFEDYITKPIVVPTVLAAITRHLNGRAAPTSG